MPKQYESARRTVVCHAQPLADGRFMGLVSVQTHEAGSVATIVHRCSGLGSDRGGCNRPGKGMGACALPD